MKRTFEAEHWRIEKRDPWDGTIVTRWKPIQHALVKVFAGKIEARCAVNVQPLQSSRTLVTFQAGMASRKSLANSPALGLAKRSSQKASRKWLVKLRADLHRHGALEAAKP